MPEQWHSLGPFTVFDLETTGLSPVRDCIVEIGAVRVDRDGTLSRFSTLIRPPVPIPARATAIHGITNEMVADAPSFTDAAYRFLEFSRGSKFVTHNARFDLGFLQESLARTGLPLVKTGAYDSIALIRKAFPHLPAYNLQALRISLHLPDAPEGTPHRAAYDAELTMAAFALAMKQLSELYPASPQQEEGPVLP